MALNYRKITHGLFWVINVLMALATIASAYGGCFNPIRWPYAAIIAMFFGPLLFADMALLLIDLIWFRKQALALAAAFLISLKPLMVFAPTNLPIGEVDPENSFTLLTYNCMHFDDNRGPQPGVTQNQTIDFIFQTDADIVNLQEVDFEDLYPEHCHKAKILPQQIRKLKEKYPFHFFDQGNHLTLLSKYPAKVEAFPFVPDSMPNVAIFKIDIREHKINLYDVHLRSIMLTPTDKALYKSLAKPHEKDFAGLREEASEVKVRLIDKLKVAFTARTHEAEYIRACLNQLPGPSIVAGDFNDIPDCYAVREIRGKDMKDAFAQAGVGPVITYHDDRFYFRIDHVLFRGPMDCVRMRRLKVPFSDHYPLLATFEFQRK